MILILETVTRILHIHNDLLVDIADSFDLMFSQSTNQVPTRYSDNMNNMNI